MKSVGIALGTGRLCAVLPGGRCLEATAVPDLTTMLAELKKAAALPRARVTVALLPPLVDMRRVQLPPLRVEERRRVLARDAVRHFSMARAPQVIGVHPRSPFAAAAEAGLITAIEDAVTAAGWSLHAVIPAHPAWARAAGSTARQSAGTVLIPLADSTEWLRVRGSEVVERRRFRASEQLPDAPALDAFPAAATFAPVSRLYELSSDARRAERQRRARRAAGGLALAATVCLMAASGIQYWGLRHELTALHARRTAIAPRVAAAMRQRDSLDDMNAVLAALDAAEREAPSWPALLIELAEYLPHDAYLETFDARVDTVTISGVAHDAASVLRELGRVSTIRGLHADGPIRQDIALSGEVQEHFRVTGQWKP